MPRVTIDGQAVDVTEGLTVLAAATAAGIDVPTLCADPRLEPSGACRLCVVMVDRGTRPVAACTTPVHDGMVVDTRTDELESHRRTLLELLAEGYPADAVADSPGEPFHRLLTSYGVAVEGITVLEGPLVDDSHPLIQVDLSRCISCWRCVRACEEVQGQFVWRITGRGADSRIVPDSGTTFGASSCVSCGACVDTCPTGALEDKDVLGAAAATTWTRTTCGYCGVGCELQVGACDGQIVAVVPAADAPANRGHVCVKGRYGHGFVTAADRVTRPMVRDQRGAWREVSWDEAIGAAAGQLRDTIERYGPDAVGVLGSARATNEENYLIQKLARAVLGTNNVDSCARVCHAPSAVGLRMMLGTGAATSSYADIEVARSILVCGSNATENHPVVGARIKQAVLHGARLIVIDPRRIELADYAEVHLRPRPGTGVALLNAMAAAVIEEGLVDEAFVANRVDGFDELERFLGAYRPETVAPLCGVDPGDIRAAACLYATATPAISFHGLGVTEHHQGTDGVMALVNLALLTGNLGRPGTGVNPLRGQNNVQGAAHMGCEPAHLPGYVPLDQGRDRVASVWGTDIPETTGLDAMDMLAAAEEGRLKALYVVGWDILLTHPNTSVTGRSLGALDSVIVQDLFLNETARELGTVFLPAASSFEKDGTFMSSERRVQRVRASVPAPGDARPDWQIACALATALGGGQHFGYRDPEEVWEEIRRVWAPGAGMSYHLLDDPGGRQWPCPAEDHPGTTLLHTETFGTSSGRAGLRPLTYEPPPDELTRDLPFVLVTGRTLYAFNAGTMTSRSATHRLRPTDLVELNPDDATAVGVVDGDSVRIVSRYGSAELAADVTDRVPTGVVFATFHDPATATNRVTGPYRDPYTNTPAYKQTAVRLEKV